ncbi:hypothetical protein KK120_05670 [Virgibacillus dakarensis]|uniref:DUF6612 family protein n=1 Tax=Virgibacillus dakarensis TaxID=1917889 RepID=UPI000B431345|nr:DUF6612 family protein [Virgibacillus dakarensis]MBT2215313.1 hypothetical protein [Virgibacillus dakarensis]
MKKWMLLIVAGVLALVLAACNKTAEPTEGTSKEKESDLTAEEVYTKALETSEKMESAEVSMNLKQRMESEADSVAMDTESKFDTKMTMDPMAVYLKGTTKMTMDGSEEKMPEMDMEMYMVDDGMYMFSDQLGGGNWLKMEGASMDAIQEMAGQQPNPSDQLKMLKDYAKDLSFEQSDNEFILKLSADGEKFNDLMQQTIKDSLPPELMQQMGEEGKQALENTKINSMNYEITIDKETFEMKTFNMDMDMAMEQNGSALNIVQNMESEYSNINKVDAIEVPADVKENAIDAANQQQ